VVAKEQREAHLLDAMARKAMLTHHLVSPF
jgi:hypothetical protein